MRNGIADIAGVPPAVLRAFSRRRAEIEAELERRGASSAAAAQVATLRDAARARTTASRRSSWCRSGASGRPGSGSTPEVVRELSGRARSTPLARWTSSRSLARLAGPHGLTRAAVDVHPSRRAAGVVRAAPARRRRDRGGDRAARRRVPRARRARSSSPRASGRESLRRARRACWSRRPAPSGSTRRRSCSRSSSGSSSTPSSAAAPGPASRRPRAVERAHRAPPVARGRADRDGAPAHAGWRRRRGGRRPGRAPARRSRWPPRGRRGRRAAARVYGAALARRAARELRGERRDPEHERGGAAAGPRATSDVDGRAALGARRRRGRDGADARARPARRARAAPRRQARPRRRPPPAAGDRRRRRVPRAAHAAAGDRAAGEPPPGGASGSARRCSSRATAPRARRCSATTTPAGSQLGADAGELRQRLVADWWAQRDPDGSMMIAQRRVDVADLNGRAHALMRATRRARRPRRCVSAGRRSPSATACVLRRNDRRLGVVNGDRGVVVALVPSEGRIDVELAGATVSLPREYLAVADAPRHAGAHARLRDHRSSRAGHDLPADVHPRDRHADARGRLRGAQPRPRVQPHLRAGAGRGGP